MSDRQHNAGRWFSRIYPWLILPLIVAVLALVALIPMTWQQQAFFGVLVVIAAVLIDRSKSGQAATILLVLLCLSATSRYAYWRTAGLWRYLRSPWGHISPVAATLMLTLFAAEVYTFLILVLGFFQSITPLKRAPLLMPESPEDWPVVDVLIPTLNESLEVVRYTVLAAQQMDWPPEKLNVILLDDGARSDFRQFAAEAGVRYIARTDHSAAKAGNLNHALRLTNGEFVTVFDCDHIPTRSFLQISIGWFLRDHRLGMLQTPHHFYSPDPFERNLGKFRRIPNEGSLFYGIVQDANDLWNATYFCGSCATLRRTAVDQIGGIAQETVTEDAHTSLRLQKAGWNTAYINIPQAAGLATETLARHIKQRIRWARGMIQILRMDNPLWARGLTLPQRLCYFNATLHFLYALPRLIFLTAPVLYLVFGLSNVPGYWLAIIAFAAPHLAVSTIANSRIQGSKRFSFWNEIYETVLSPYILLPTIFAMLNPKSGAFNVTDKGGAQQQGYFSFKLSMPFLFLLLLNLVGLSFAIPRYLYWDRGHSGTIWINVFWAFLNVVILGVALSVCAEQRQRRHAVRIPSAVPILLHAGGETYDGMTADLSTTGLAAQTGVTLPSGEPVEIGFPEDEEEERLRGRVIGGDGGRLRIQFAPLSLLEQRLLTRVLYTRADRWLDWDNGFAPDRPLLSFMDLLQSSMAGLWKLFFARPGFAGAPSKPLEPVRAAVITGFVLAILGFAFWRANASTARAQKEPAPELIERSFTLGSLARPKDVFLLKEPGSRVVLKFATPQSWLLQGGKLQLKYQIPRNARDQYTYADIRLNDSLIASITPTVEERDAGAGELIVPLPPDLLLTRNELTIQLTGQGNSACAASVEKNPPWFRIDPSSQVALEAQPLALASELSALPQPFLEHLANSPVVVPFVFVHRPDAATLQSAGVLASWFGSLADDSGVRYYTQVGGVPTGNAVVLLVGTEQIEGTSLANQSGVSLQANPSDPYGKVLVIHGQTSEDLLAVVQALSTGQLKMAGSSAYLNRTVALPARAPNDAPRWIHNQRVSLADLAGPADLRIKGQNPLTIYMHLSPDYNFGVQQNVFLHLAYSADPADLAKSSNVASRLNGVPLGSVPLLANGEEHDVDVPFLDVPAAVYANTLQIQFYFVPAGADPCAPGAANSSAQILGSSYLDLGGAVHYVELPNLNLFAKAGFPFTRMADLSETAVVLPSTPSPEVLGLYLDLMGYFGAQTGYPTTRLQVVSASDTAQMAGKDLLVLGSFVDLAGIPEITENLPLTYAGLSFTLSLRARLALTADWVTRRNSAAWQAMNDTDNLAPQGIVEGIASPFARGRSVVVIAGRNRAALPGLASALLTTMPLEGIDGTVSLWTGNSFVSYPLSTAVYGSEVLPWYRAFGYWLPHHPFVLLLLLLLALAVLGFLTQQFLAVRVRMRLALAQEGSRGSFNTAT
ncbi:MAG TPA: UDP-forming cellulose synthase catalytic subunit [Acidobacteriaceae bacterium]|nr:UDP-forming cellulose synthase catalytic subunit [Acidobacteriaceae bacterium]